MNQVATCFACLALQTMVTSGETVNGDSVKMNGIKNTWTGMLPLDCVAQLPETQRTSRIGVIGDEDSWSTIWKAYQPGKNKPPVDFTTQRVVFIKNVRYLNRITFVSAEHADGMLTLKTKETRSARPIRDQLHCVMIIIDRQGIQRVSDGRHTISIE